MDVGEWTNAMVKDAFAAACFGVTGMFMSCNKAQGPAPNIEPTSSEHMVEISLSQTQSQPSRDGMSLGWQLSIRAPGTWNLDLGPSFDSSVFRHENDKQNETINLFHKTEVLGIMEVPSGNYGIRVPDYPFLILCVTSNFRARRYLVGSLGNVERSDPVNAENAALLQTICCEIIDMTTLPPQALNRSSELRGEIDRHRSK